MEAGLIVFDKLVALFKIITYMFKEKMYAYSHTGDLLYSGINICKIII